MPVPLSSPRDVKLVVISGSGKYFSAGFELGDHQGDRAYLMLESFHRIFEGLAKAWLRREMRSSDV